MKTVTQKTQSVISRLASLGGHFFVLLIAFAALGGVFYITQVHAQESTSYHTPAAETYCKSITPTVKNNACKDGWDNKQDCNNYQELNFDPSVASSDLVKACTNAREDKEKCSSAAINGTTAQNTHAPCPKGVDTGSTDEDKDVLCSTTTTKTKDTTTTTTTRSNDAKDEDCDPEKLQSDLDKACAEVDLEKASNEVKNICKNSAGDKDAKSKTDEEVEKLKKEVEALKKELEKPLPGCQYGQYVNGANEYQAMRINRAPGDNNAAIVLFHGGGWTSDDGAADKFAAKAVEHGYSTFVATYRLGTSGVYYQLDDALRAIAEVRNCAGMYGVDPNRIGVWGDSAGGSLAVRAASTGKTGTKVQVGWSAPTNAYTAIFHSARAFAVGMSHSTCAPTDLEGINDTLDQINGGQGTGQPTGPNTTGNTAQDVLTLADQAQKTGQSVEEISKKLEDEEGQKELSGNVRRLAAKKFLECIDNFNSASPALFARPGSPPGLFAGYDKDPLVHPGQAFQMRDKLRALGVPAEAVILPVEAEPTQAESAIGLEKDGLNHLGFHEKFVCPTLEFMDKFLKPNNPGGSCGGGAPAENADNSGGNAGGGESTQSGAQTAQPQQTGGGGGTQQQTATGPLCGIDEPYVGWTWDGSSCNPPGSVQEPSSPQPQPAVVPTPDCQVNSSCYQDRVDDYHNACPTLDTPGCGNSSGPRVDQVPQSTECQEPWQIPLGNGQCR